MTTSIPIGDLEEAIEIESIIQDRTIDNSQKASRLNETTMEWVKRKKRSSYETIFNISNTMMGSALLVMPIGYYKSGIITSLISSIIIAIISFITANIQILHSRDDEIDYPEAIERIIGKFWAKIYNAVSMFFLLMIGIIHFIFMTQTFYSILINIFDSQNWGAYDEIVFNNFSLQYVALIIFLICAVLFSIKDLKHILKVNDKGVYLIVIFCLYLIYLGFDVLMKCDLTISITGVPGVDRQGLNLILLDSDIFVLIGVFATAFFIHNAHTGIFKTNKNQANNTRDLGISYLIVWFLYSVMGLIGMIAVAGLYNEMYSSGHLKKIPETIMELIVKENNLLTNTGKLLGCVSMFLLFIQLSTVIPIICFFTRRQFYDLIYGPRYTLSDLQIHIFNQCYNFICLIITISVLPISSVISFTGAIGGFLLVYVIPVYVHIKCLYANEEENQGKIFKV